MCRCVIISAVGTNNGDEVSGRYFLMFCSPTYSLCGFFLSSVSTTEVGHAGRWICWKRKKWKKVYTPGCVCMSVGAKVLIRYRLLGSASRLRESTPRVYIFPILALHTHTHSPPSPLPLPPDFFFRFSIDMAHAAHSCSSLAKRGRLLYVVDEGCRKYFYSSLLGNLVRIHWPRPCTPRIFSGNFTDPSFFFFFFASLNRNWDDDIFEKKSFAQQRKPPYPPPCENSCLNLVQLLGPGWWRWWRAYTRKEKKRPAVFWAWFGMYFSTRGGSFLKGEPTHRHTHTTWPRPVLLTSTTPPPRRKEKKEGWDVG